MACRLPGADGLEAFWDLVVHGRTAWGRLPQSRLPRELYFDPEKGKVGKSYSDLGALVSDRPADPAVCPLRPDMLRRYDVAHHVFLEVASLACRDAGLDPFAMPRSRRTGVYVGHTGGSTRIGDYVYSTGIDGTAAWLAEVAQAREVLGGEVHRVAEEVVAAVRGDHPGRNPGEKLDLGALGAAKIVHEALGIDGPYLVVDAACASSLQALAIAARALRQGGVDQAIVGGASYCKSDSLVLFSAAQSVSNTGSCPFGRGADGLVTAEGYVALVVKTLARAVADGDRIRAVIRGIGVASDGKGKSLWAPRQEGQKLAVERAYPDRSDIARLDYIEAHATSTQVGDATELGALASLLSANIPAGRKIPIGSVKANIGHTLETAGMASLVKVVLAMEHGVIPPGSTCTEYNDDFDWSAGPFTVPTAARPWPARADGLGRRAAVNAFGIGGLNVHLAIAQHVASQAAVPDVPARRTDDHEAVAIVGIGSVLPGALTTEAFHALLDAGISALGDVPSERWDLRRALDASGPRAWHTTAGLGGFVRGFDYDWRRHKVPPKQIAAANPLQFMLLEAADAAIAGVGGVAGLDRIRTAVVVGTMFGGEFSNDLQMGLRLPETSRHLRTSLRRRGVAAADAERIIEAYGKKVLEKMPALVDETGSFTSSTLASRLTKSFDLMGGALALDSGDCSGVSAMAAAVDLLRQRECDAVLCAAGQRYLDLMAYEGLSLDGMLAPIPASPFGARRAGRVPAEGAVVLVLKRLGDAKAAGNTIHGVIRGVAVGAGRSLEASLGEVVRDARQQAGIAAAAVRTAEIVGSGDPALDGTECRCVTDEYGLDVVGGSVEGTIGHLGAAAAAAGVVKLARVLDRGVMPATLGGHDAGGAIRVDAVPLPVPAIDAAGYRAGTVTVAHGTQVGHVVMDNGRPVPAVARDLPGRRPEPASVASAVPSGRSRVAALFPGQGSQYTDMFRTLAAESADVRRALEALDHDARSAGLGTLAETAWRADNGLGTRVWDTQWGMYLGDLLAWRTLEAMGFAPDVVASHSFGEFPSLVASGAWTFAVGAAATAARAAAVDELGPRDGAMLSVIAPRAEVEEAIAPFAGSVWVCAHNAPEQSVIGGHARAIDAVETVLETRRVRSKRLAVPSPFHTPLLAAAAGRLSEAIDRLPIHAPALRVYSSTTATWMGAAADIRESLVRQMTHTVRWVEVVEALWQEGVRTFVEVGPSGVLTGLTRRILEGREGATFIQFDQRGRDAAAHLARIREQLARCGALGSLSSPALLAARPAVAATAVLTFDATTRRRARNRTGGGVAPTMSRPAMPTSLTESNGSSASHGSSGGNGSSGAHGANGANGHAHGNGHHAPAVQSVVVEPVPLPAVTTPRTGPSVGVNRLAAIPSVPQVASGPTGSAALEADLVDFVVDQTGYPREIVELDADLEGDLGIDSIRKAQLFGEIGQKYGLSADASVSLDDFRTLRHLLDYMAPRVGGKTSARTQEPPVQASPVTPASKGHAGSNGHAPHAHPAPRTEAAVVSASSTALARSRAGASPADLETFLVDFVVDQTGYPREIVELDADLEGDLGIDSIRKAQLFGEIGQTYGLSADASVSLDDFRTLRHLLDYMVPRVGGTAAPPSPAPRAVPVPAAAAAPAPATAAATSPGGPSAGDLETFLVDFVVEQTGYPREIVELDADLEGDLGIDSIRKAQLFGEIGQTYGLSADASVSLDDFRTLRHLLDYMAPRVGGTVSAVTVAPPPTMPPAAASPSPSDARVLAWTRSFAAARPAVGDEPSLRLPPEAAATIAATATAARIEADVLRAALAAPAAALGGLDVAFSTVTPRGLAAAFGRAAAPSCRPCSRDGVHGWIVGIEGLPGAVLAWNEAGIVLAVSAGQARAGGGLPAACAVEALAACRSLGDVADAVTTLTPLSGPLHAVDARLGVAVTIAPSGAVTDAGPALVDLAALSPLSRVAGGADGGVSFERLLDPARGAGVRDGLSASSTWLAAGVGTAFSGSPQGTWLPADAEAALARMFHPAAEPPGLAAGACVTVRFALSLSPLGPPAARRGLGGERVLIIGADDAAGRGLSAALARHVGALGATAEVIEQGSVAATLAALDAVESRGPARHLVVCAPFSAPAEWVAGREVTIHAGYFACQRWLAARSRAADLARSTLTAVTALGGDFGLSGAIASPVGGAFSGLFKGLAREYPDLQVRVVDVAADTAADRVATLVSSEMAAEGPVEVGYASGRRQTVVAVDRAPRTADPLAGLAAGSVWIVTGGARGVTAACARALGVRHRLKLVLVGSTRPRNVEPGWTTLDEAALKALKGRVMLEAKQQGADPRGAWREVEKSIEIAREMERFRAAGVDARYEPCDLSDAAAVGALVSRIERGIGPVRGIVHGAGWESACKFEKKTAEGLAATLGPKCVGLENLLAAVDRRTLGSVVAFGSTSGRLGGLGQADYSAANDMLAKIVGRLRGGPAGIRATVFHWHAWDEVGMASRPESRFVLEKFGMTFMPLAEGVGRFMDEIAAGLPDAEVLVTEPMFCLDRAPAATAPAGSLVGSVERSAAGALVSFRLDPRADVFLTHHRQFGRPLLPAVMGAELLAQAALAAGCGGDAVGEIRDFAVERPVSFPTDDARSLAVDIDRQADGSVRGALRAADDGQVLVSGVVSAVVSGSVDATFDQAPFPWNPMVYQDDGPMWHGPAFRTLTGLFLDRSGGWGRLESPDPDVVAGPRGAAGWTVPVAMLDGAIVACGVYSYILCGKRVEIPVRFERLCFVSPAATGESCVVRLRFRSQDAQCTTYDLAIFGADGRVILLLDGLRMSVLSQERSRPS